MASVGGGSFAIGTTDAGECARRCRVVESTVGSLVGGRCAVVAAHCLSYGCQRAVGISDAADCEAAVTITAGRTEPGRATKRRGEYATTGPRRLRCNAGNHLRLTASETRSCADNVHGWNERPSPDSSQGLCKQNTSHEVQHGASSPPLPEILTPRAMRDADGVCEGWCKSVVQI